MLAFQPLTRNDLPLLHEWVQRPHVAAWWHAPATLVEIERHYLPRTPGGESSTRVFIVMRDGDAIGFIQSYVVMGSGDGWWASETDPGARGIDQFLANEHQLGQGLGSAMVRAFVEELFRDPVVTKVQTDPSPANERAIRCYRRAGFVSVGEVRTPDGAAYLMLATRPSLARASGASSSSPGAVA